MGIQSGTLSNLVKLDPFPHLYCERYLPIQICDEISAHWPKSETMAGETDIIGERSFADFAHDDQISLAPFGAHQEFWRGALQSIVRPMLYDIAEAFLPFIAAKFGPSCPETINLQIHRLMCLQAESGFVEHTPHSHCAAPNWVFTFLLYLDDCGREDRGTSLYRVSNTDLFESADCVLLNRFASATTEEAYRAPFRRGALLAFYDSPLSVHGSTPFKDSGEDSSRRILRGHISLGPKEVERIYSRKTEALNAEVSQLISKGVSPRSTVNLDRDLANMRAFSSGQSPNIPREANICFPALVS